MASGWTSFPAYKQPVRVGEHTEKTWHNVGSVLNLAVDTTYPCLYGGQTFGDSGIVH